VARFLGSARGRLLAVLDAPAELDAVIRALAETGIVAPKVEIFSGDDGAAAFDGSGAGHGALARLLRTVQFTLMDQMPDFAYYEAAARQGRSVMSVKPRNEAEMRRIVDVLRAHRGHFINYFGRFTTEEFVRWRGQEPELPEFMRR
jgi:hypothetical protein